MTTPRKQAIREWTMLALAVCVTLAAIVVAYYAPQVLREEKQILTTQQAGIVRSYRLRAIGCRNLQAITKQPFKSGDDCLDPHLRPYFTPDP